MNNLSFSVMLAPYRVDYYNTLYNKYNFLNFFQTRNYKGHLFTEKQMLKLCSFEPKFLDCISLPGSRNIAKGLYGIIKSNKPEFVIAPEFSLLTLQIILLKIFFQFNYRIIIKSDDSYSMIKNGGFTWIHSVARALLVRFSDDVVLADKRTVEWYREKYNKGIWLPIIQNEKIIRDNNIDEVEKKALEYKREYHLSDVYTILFVGRLVDVKNLPVLFDACRKLDFPYRLVIVGDGVLKDEWKRICKDTSINAIFVGGKNGADLYAWYYASDLFVLPSKMEPFGAVTNEALLFGCNCIVSDKAGSSCIIEQGVNGYLFNPYDADDLKKKIDLCKQTLKSDDRNSKMSHNFDIYIADAFDRIMKRTKS